MRSHGEAVQVAGNIKAQVLDGGVPRIALLGTSFRANRLERAVNMRGESRSCFLREKEPQQRAERENIAARIELFDFAASLLRRHKTRGAHHGAVPRDGGAF